MEDSPESKKFYKSEPSCYRFFYGGTLSLQFDLLPLLKAMKKSQNNFHITLVGDNGSGERAREVLDFLDLNRISYENLGLLEKKSLIQQLATADIAVLPMISGGLPKKFFDALGSYKPILCMGKGGAFDEIEKHGLGWATSFEVGDIQNILDRMNKEILNFKIKNIVKYRYKYIEQHSLETIHGEILKLK